MKFNYQARTEKGEVRSGAIEASSRENAIQLLQKYGLYVTALEEAKETPAYARRIKLFERTSVRDIVLFSRQLSIMFGSKVSLVESLRTLANQTKNLDFKDKILKISEEIEGGTAFSNALSKHPKIFSSFYVAMVKAGETSGKLSGSLDYLAEHLEREYYLVGKIRGAMIYPSLIVSVALGVLILMTVFVVPNLSKVLEESGGKLPAITVAVINLSKFLRQWGWVLFLGIIALAVSAFRYSKTQPGKIFFDRAVLKLPLVSPFLKMIYLSRLAENLSTLISGGIPIAQSLDICGKIVENSVYREIIFQARDEVRKGEAISQVLIRFPKEFSPIFIQMALVGERTGTLDKTLLNLAGFYQKETDRMMESLLGVLEPLLIVFLGISVGGIMAAILMPLYQMSSGV
ncbi:MAG: type II secretion system F family protein [Candidatus Wildermuthbacteria bacterium]|nr:type II secretion system F family protein [Candidatus Wildermuthbacteria bacterium]